MIIWGSGVLGVVILNYHGLIVIDLFTFCWLFKKLSGLQLPHKDRNCHIIKVFKIHIYIYAVYKKSDKANTYAVTESKIMRKYISNRK